MTKTIDHSTLVYQGNILSVTKNHLTFSNNNQAVFELVKFHIETGVSALPVDQGQIILIKHYHLGVDQETYSLPSGGLEYGEDPEERMQLELQEEIGFKAKKLALLMRSHPLPGYLGTSPGYIYYATDLISSKRIGDEPYPIRVQSFELETVLTMIQSGIIYDLRTISAILMYKLYYT